MGTSAVQTSPALQRYNALRDQGSSPEEAAQRVASEFPNLEEMHPEVKGMVTAGPVQDIGTPASEVARLKSTGPMAGRIEASLRAMPEETARPGLGKVTSGEIEKQHPWSLGRGLAEQVATGAVSNVAPDAADATETMDIDRLARSGVDVSKHANALAAANLLGFVGGGLPLAGGGEAGEAVGKIAKASSNVLRASAERAAPTAGRITRLAGHMGRTGATMGTLAAEGGALEQQDPATVAKNVAIQTATGAAFGGLMAPETRAIASEAADLAGRGMAASATRPGGRPLTGSVDVGRRVGAIGDVSQFPDPRPARAAGTPVENVPTMDTQRPRMFKEKDFELSPEGAAEFASIMGPTGVQQRVTWADAEALARTIGTDPNKILRNTRDLSGEEILALKQGVSQNVERIVSLNKIATDPTATAEAQQQAAAEVARRMEDVSAMAARVTRETSQKGRDLNLMKVMGLNTMDPGVWTTFAAKVKGLPLSADEVIAITKAASERDREGLAQIVSSLKTMTPWEKVVTTWKAGLLTNPKTHAVNIVGNTGMATSELLKDYPATAVDLLLSLATGTRTKALPSISGVAESARQFRTQGLQAAMSALRTGMTPEEIQKWDFRNGRFGKTLGSERLGRVLDLYTQSVFRTLGAEDQLFKAVAIGRSLDEQIRVEAGNIVRTWKRNYPGPVPTFAFIAKQLRANVPDAMQAQAIADAEYATFNNPNLIASAANAFKNKLKSGGGAFWAAGEGLAPFVRTPTNILERTLDYTPAGVLRAVMPAVEMIQGQAIDANQKKVAEALGRASIGSMLIGLGFMAYLKGRATGTLPMGQKTEWEVRGRTPGAMKAGGHWYTVVRMQPQGTLLTLGAEIASLYEQGGGVGDVAAGSAFAVGRIVSQMPFLQGISGFNEALTDQTGGSKAGQFVRSQAASVVPAIVSAVARGTVTKRDPQTIAQAVEARIPGLAKRVPAALDAFGREIPQEGVAGQMFDVTNRTADRETPMLKQMRDLGVGLSKPGRTISVEGKTYTLSPEEYRVVLQQVGPEIQRRLEAAFALPVQLGKGATPELTDLAQRDRLSEAIRDAKGMASEQMAGQIYRAEKQGAEHVGTLRIRRPKF